jgi:hypothetical protein
VILTDGEPDNSASVLGEFNKALAPLEAARAAGKAPNPNQIIKPQPQHLTLHQATTTAHASALSASDTT